MYEILGIHKNAVNHLGENLRRIEFKNLDGQKTTTSLLTSPNSTWRQRAFSLGEKFVEQLWSVNGVRALNWIRSRGLTDEVIMAASFGYNSEAFKDSAEKWGLTGKGVFIPRGVTIPWMIGNEIWRLNIRRPKGSPKYLGPRGFSNGLYNSDSILPELPVVLVEGEFDAWSIWQCEPNLIRAVATGSTSGSRRPKWFSKLSLVPLVLVAFDSDVPGENASSYWTRLLPNAIRWRPYWKDLNTMLQDKADLSSWVKLGIEHGGMSIN